MDEPDDVDRVVDKERSFRFSQEREHGIGSRASLLHDTVKKPEVLSVPDAGLPFIEASPRLDLRLGCKGAELFMVQLRP